MGGEALSLRAVLVQLPVAIRNQSSFNNATQARLPLPPLRGAFFLIVFHDKTMKKKLSPPAEWQSIAQGVHRKATSALCCHVIVCMSQ